MLVMQKGSLKFKFWIQNFEFWAVTASSGTKLTVFHGFPWFSMVFHCFPWFSMVSLPAEDSSVPGLHKGFTHVMIAVGHAPNRFEIWILNYNGYFLGPKIAVLAVLASFLTRESFPGTQHPAGAFCVWWLRLVIHHEAWYSNFEFKILNLSCNG